MKTTTSNVAFIVEDNEMYSTMMDHMLSTDCDCRFLSFKTGEECIQNLYMNPFLILLDYGLPGINGLETIKEIKKYNQETPIVILTGKNDMTIARDFFNAGAYDYVVKDKSAVHRIKKIVNTILNDRNKKMEVQNKNQRAWIFRGLLMLFFTALAMNILWP